MGIELIAIVLLSAVLAVVLAGYDQRVKEINSLKEEQEETERKARQQALRIIEDARNKAISILQQVTIDTQRQKELLDSQVGEITQQQLKEYKQYLQKVSKEIEKGVEAQAKDYQKILEIETVGAEKVVAAKIEEGYIKAEKDVEVYKQKLMDKAREEIVVIIAEASQELLGKTITIDDQTELIMQALEEAKKQHVF
ncbi:hypothetical protein A2701_00865 [Candidatus Amesbacteria bacterium RIFCSPHIGHO2_01_FULL_47_34]|uniref:ATP synthase subunit b n=2 Tax=Candidatus Amesiibacteriota TaxID=1752730 RepID=A0A1F4ZW74_9BACT|nr:MAG: hypothetical protein A2701_00865 [Candidatus Amesbacteria bacterium RIFCSPHIGHO2_01_FULL_47_34]OGD01161.1 MAG: hypothetical protein A2972_05125 [Candidatus Amesbacteria bacterium RIFCSPLOWO2_01_FULL_47_33]OGD09644.1 MAG: hypothetical protein A2395_03535 [Candidatus Amesbacteria bacterium RIFOXYB1_FULL_47_9]